MSPSTDLGLPTHLEVYPEIAAAALKAGLENALVSWSLFRVADRDGRGYIERPDAHQILEASRGVQARQTRRLLQEGDPGWWTTDRQERLWLPGPATVAEHLGLAFLGRPHLVPLSDLCAGRAQRRAALEATLYRTDAQGHPLSRRRVRELTGVPESTQRRYENQYGHARVVDPVHTHLTHITADAAKSAIAHEYSDRGAYLGGSGDLMRRHADRRQATRHLPGSSRKARRANTQLAESARSDSPAKKTRGERSGRAFFPMTPNGRSGVKQWMKTPAALGKPGHERGMTDAIFDYAVIERRGKGGKSLYASAVLPEELERGHRLAGSLQTQGRTSPRLSAADVAHSRPNDDRSTEEAGS